MSRRSFGGRMPRASGPILRGMGGYGAYRGLKTAGMVSRGRGGVRARNVALEKITPGGHSRAFRWGVLGAILGRSARRQRGAGSE